MKKILYIALMASNLLFTTACVDLNQEPQSFITEEEYLAKLDIDGLRKAATGLYNDLWQSNYGFNCRMQIINIGGDEITYATTKANNRYAYFADLNPSADANKDDVSIPWNLFFAVVNNSNKLINNVVIPEGTTDALKKKQKEYQEVLGEAYFMRGLAYFYLVRMFGDVPLILNGTDAETRMPRTSVAEIYEKAIVPSLTKATEWLPEKSRSGFSSTPSKWAAKACLADVYMTMAGWPLKKGTEYYAKAAQETNDIIEKSGLKLTPKYEDLWKEAKKEDANEHLFALHHSAKQKTASNYGKSYYPNDFYPKAGWADYYGVEAFYLKYPAGERKDWNYMTEWPIAKDVVVNYKDSREKNPAISKYYDYDEGVPGNSAQANGITCIYRYADVLLMYAEASTRATNSVNALAAKCLKDVQERAKSAVITNTTDPTTFEKAVFDENGWEFFAEMRRWFDLVRLEKVSEVRSTAWTNSIYKANNHYYLPIAEEQIRLTGWTNNAGY
ncbi:RagB/SusD family nutrient uptake outer membrane protein [Bacteroides sp.]|uniref:RagB/SusD family nutrient uptake outer membrane protein n=1 Tax=Bacteroides sp. TaxID=29523 RepID=UPI0026124CDB|nr:RagB/SusD family nutrient uptake outer membrane protein [Bacteroides sp.]